MRVPGRGILATTSVLPDWPLPLFRSVSCLPACLVPASVPTLSAAGDFCDSINLLKLCSRTWLDSLQMPCVHDMVAGQQGHSVQYPPPPLQALLRTHHLPGDGMRPSAAGNSCVCVEDTLSWSRDLAWTAFPGAVLSAAPRPWRPVPARDSPARSSTGGLQALCPTPGGSQGRNQSSHRDPITVLSLTALPLELDVLGFETAFHIFHLFMFACAWFWFAWLF